MFVLNNKTVLQPGKSWKDDNGLTHPNNWARAWSTEEKTARGIKEVTMQSKPDDKFYWVTGPALDGTWTSTERSLEDVKQVDDDGNAILDADGNQVIALGLKSQWLAKTKETANSLLVSTDWQVIAKAERDRAIDSNVATYRAAVITACTAIRKSITDITYPETPSDYAAAKAKHPDNRTDAEKKIVSDHDADLAAVFTSFKALFDAPVDSDNKPTGNPPMYDWPVMGE